MIYQFIYLFIFLLGISLHKKGQMVSEICALCV